MSAFTDHEIEHILRVKLTIKNMIQPFILKLLLNSTTSGLTTKMFVSGGVTASLINDEKPNDIDVYFTEYDSMNIITDFIKLKHWDYIKSVSENYREYLGVNGKLITENAITLDDGVQLITKAYGKPEGIRKTFDFVHCTPYYSLADDKLYISRQQYDAIVKQQLITNSSMMPTPGRIEKFKKRGYSYDATR